MQLPAVKDFMNHLRALESFLSDRQLRRTFLRSCLVDQPCFDSFTNYSTIHINWRWAFLSKALDKLVVGALVPRLETPPFC